jgi:tetrahydromethanopterin S-methyltransferase subunit H
MYFNQVEPKVVEISGVSFGAQPGEYAPVLIGSITARDKIDAKTAGMVRRQETLRKQYGIPCLVDVYVREESHLERIDFVLDNTKDDEPFLIDLPGELEIRKKAVGYASKTNCLHRVIYNSIGLGTGDEELRMIRDTGVKSAILLAYDSADLSPEGALYLLKGGGLLEKTIEAGIENILIDPGIGAFSPDRPFNSFKSITFLKVHTGYPVGCAPCNAVEGWSYMRQLRKAAKSGAEKDEIRYGRILQKTIETANAIAYDRGADFLIYGNLRNSDEAVAVATGFHSNLLLSENSFFGIKPGTEDHPVSKL